MMSRENLMTRAALERKLLETQQVLSDLLQEKLPRVYVVQTEGLHQEVLGVFLNLARAKFFLEQRMGGTLEWKHGNSHGNMWWPARNGTGVITEQEVACD